MLNPENLAGSCDPTGRLSTLLFQPLASRRTVLSLEIGALVHFSFKLEQLAISLNQPGSTLFPGSSRQRPGSTS